MLSTNFFLFQLSRIAFAFKELLLEKSIDKITINDITEKCGINRQTFYYHFHDIYELIEWICETDADHVLKQIIERLNALIQGSFTHALNNAKLNRS